MKISLRYKLLISFMIVVIVVLAGVTAGGSALIREYFITTKRHELTDKAHEMARVVNTFYDGRITHGQLNNFVNSVDSFLDARVWVVDNQLNLVTVSEEQPDQGYGTRRPASVVKPSPMRPMWDCDMPFNAASPQAQQPQTPKQDKPANQPGGMWDCDTPGVQGNTGGKSPSSQGMMGMWGRHSQNQMPGEQSVPTNTASPPKSKEPPAVTPNQPNNVVLDVGKGQTGAPSNAVLSLAEIKGTQELGREIEANAGKVWSKIYYHPYYEENVMLVAVPLVRPDGTVSGTVMINTPLEEIEGFLRRIYYYIGLAGLAGILLATLLAGYLSGGIVRPLKSMQETAAAMAKGDYSARTSISTRDEVGELGQSLNWLAHDLGAYVGELEKMDKMRRDFVANVSHELRTPLTIMQGYNQALQDGAITDPAKVTKYHKVMGNEIARLEKLIAELLDLSQLQASGVTLEKEPVYLVEVIDNVITLLKPRSEEKGVTLVADIAQDIPPVTGDGDRLTQLVLILMDNALKFTAPGGRITAGLTMEKGREVLNVTDTGVGIPLEDIPFIWERFYKADKSRASGGTGLGLAIAKQIADLHGAEAEVYSMPGEGTKFMIRFPIQ